MRKGKYIICKRGAILFSEAMSHADFKHFDPVSAGFFSVYATSAGIEVACYGSSVSLGLKAEEGDEGYVRFAIGQ